MTDYEIKQIAKLCVAVTQYAVIYWTFVLAVVYTAPYPWAWLFWETVAVWVLLIRILR